LIESAVGTPFKADLRLGVEMLGVCLLLFPSSMGSPSTLILTADILEEAVEFYFAFDAYLVRWPTANSLTLL